MNPPLLFRINDKREGVRSAYLTIAFTFPFLAAFPHRSSSARKKKETPAHSPLFEPLLHPSFTDTMVQQVDLVPWGKSTANQQYLETLITARVLLPNTDLARLAWIAPEPTEVELKPPSGYIMSLARLHKQGFGMPARRFLRALCDYYRVE